MSRRNKHIHSYWRNDVNTLKCPRRGCSGTLIQCLVRYKPRSPVAHELECSDCGLVRRDKSFRPNRKPWQQKQKR